MRESSHRVEALEGRKGLARFIDVPWHIFDRADYPQWSPPLRTVMRDLLDPARDPFYKNADIRMFVATGGGRMLGRIAAIESRSHNRHFGDRVGFFGFFECVDDPAVAGSLFAAAEGWLRERGLDVCRGPVNPSMNHECGLLVDGCDGETMVLTPWNPSYYDRLLSAAGYAGAKDLLAYEFPLAEGFELPERMARLASRASERARLTFRDMDLRHATDEMRHLWPVFTEAWEGNWGFVPPDEEEFIHLAKGLLPLMVPKLCTVAEINGEPMGFWLTIRNFNKIFRKIPSGRLGPAALWHLLVSAKKVTEGRVAVFGIRKEARKQGLFAVFAHEAMVRSAALGMTRGEGSWILEDNVDLTSPLELLGAHAYRRWRLYDKGLT